MFARRVCWATYHSSVAGRPTAAAALLAIQQQPYSTGPLGAHHCRRSAALSGRYLRHRIQPRHVEVWSVQRKDTQRGLFHRQWQAAP